MNIQKGKTLACHFSLHPLSLARWATPHLHLFLLTSAKFIRLKESTWEKFKLLCLKKKGNLPINPSSHAILDTELRHIYQTLKCLISFGVENTLCCKPV